MKTLISGFKRFSLVLKLIQIIKENSLYILDMILVNFIRFIGVTIVSFFALELMSQYMLVTSITAFSVLFSMLGLDIEMLSNWTQRKYVVRQDTQAIIFTILLSTLVGIFAGYFWIGELMILLSMTSASFIMNRFTLIFCYALNDQKNRFISNAIYQAINLIGILLYVNTRSINYLLFLQTTGFLVSSLYIMWIHRNKYRSRKKLKSQLKYAKFFSTHLIQVTNNLLVRGDIYLSSRLLSGREAGLLASLVSYSDIGDILPKTFNNVLFVNDQEGSNSRRAALFYFSALLFFTMILYYLIGYKMFNISIMILLLVSLAKSSFFAGNILLTKYLALAEKRQMVYLNTIIIASTFLFYLNGASIIVLLGLLSLGSVLRFVLMYKSV